MIKKQSILPSAAPGHAEGMIPGHVLAKYHVVFDYPVATLTIAPFGVLTPKDIAMPMLVATCVEVMG